MDPKANLTRQLDLAQSILRDWEALGHDEALLRGYDVAELAELVVALAEWRMRGGACGCPRGKGKRGGRA